MKFRSIWSWRKTLEGPGDHPRSMLGIPWMVGKAAATAHSSHRIWPETSQSFVLSLDLQAPFSSRNVLPWFLFIFSLIFTVYDLCELTTAGKINVLPFNSDQHTQFREVSCNDLKKLLPGCRVFHCLYWCILHIYCNSSAIISTYNSWYSHKCIQYYLFPRFESISFLFSCTHSAIHCNEQPRTPQYLSRSSFPRSTIMFIIICVSFINLSNFFILLLAPGWTRTKKAHHK